MTSASHRRQGGMAVIAVMVLIAVLFLGGTVMALAVSSSLHTVGIVSAQDAVHYAAESAVARGIAATDKCSTSGSLTVGSGLINHQPWSFWCHGTDEWDDEQSRISQIGGLGRSAVPGQQLSSCSSIALPLAAAKATAWTVVGWRGSGQVQAWMDTNGSCSSQVGSDCRQTAVIASVMYVRCHLAAGQPYLHFDGHDVNVSPSIIRWSTTGASIIRTVVGISSFEVDEADVVGAKQVLWNTVLP